VGRSADGGSIIGQMRVWTSVEQLGQDLRFAVRMLRRSLGFSAVALVSLALGIGSTTAIFSVVYGVLIAPYPYANPGDIWAPEIQDARNPRQGRGSHWLSEYLEIRTLPAFSSVMATSWETQLLTGGDHPPESVSGILLSSNAFQFLGVPPLIGRTILPSDVKPTGEAEPVVVLSYKAWHRWFDGEASALGKTLLLNDRVHTVIGVMPPRFGWYGNDGVWLPLPTDGRPDRLVNAIIRLQTGISKEAAEQQLHAIHVRLAQEHPQNFPSTGFITRLRNYLDVTVASGAMRSSLRLLFGAVGFLLLIACANVANLQLARATSRAREIGVRMSVGASRARVLTQLFTESVLLSILGGGLGVVLSVAFTRAIIALMPEFYLPNEARITVNVYVLLFSVSVSVLTGMLFGLAPAIHGSRADLVEALKDGPRGSGTGATGGKTRGLLVVAEVALAVILLVGASLTLRGLLALQEVDVGFQPDRVLTVALPLSPKRYTTYEQRTTFAQDLLERVKSLPGVESAAIGNGGLPYGGPQSGFSIEGGTPPEEQRIRVGLISADYTRTLGIPLHTGRGFTEQDIIRADRVALINEAAIRLWPAGANPIGTHIRLDYLERPDRSVIAPTGGTPSVTVVGIIANTKNAGLSNPPAPAVFVPYTLLAPPARTLAVRTLGKPISLLTAVRQQVHAIDREQPVGRPITLEEILGFEIAQPRFNVALFSFFGMLGLALAAAGIYSVLSYNVARRTHEIGVRMALGARRRDVLALMLASGGRLILIGLGIGLLGSFALDRYLRSEVFQVPATDPVAITGALGLLSGAALLACYIPARRAARVDPMVALKHE
jgi:putative ABC transport system permease protein